MAGILGGEIDDFGAHKGAQLWPSIPAKVGMRAIHRGSRFLGVIVRVMPDGVVIRGASSDERAFRFMPGAFMVDAGAVPSRVAIVDDVLTTGATAEALALALRRAGCRRIEVWAIARA